MVHRACLLVALSGAMLAGCNAGQPYVTPERLDRGLVLVLPGIEGRSSINEEVCRGLNDGGVNCAIELVDWTTKVPGAYLVNLWSELRNRQRAAELADRVSGYQSAHPGRPVVLVGQSGGGAIAVWIAESMPPGRMVDGVILLAASLSPDCPLEPALSKSRRGIVSFHSHRDWAFLGAGTIVYGTMDGQHTSSAGHVGFNVPAAASRPGLYGKLFQIAWHEQMQQAGHSGGHLSSGAAPFVARYVAPLVNAVSWDGWFIEALLAGESATRPGRLTGGQ